jgi:serine/threonine-protein kinase
VQEAARLGQYVLERELGQGGMGVVYLAKHAMLRRPTAVKLLPPDRAGKQALARFEREVQLTSALRHPNTIAIYDYGRTPDGVFYYAMEYLDGLDLERVVQAEGPLPPERVVHVLRQVAGALEEAHAAGLVHRDIKPSNIVLCRYGNRFDFAKVLDFGLVRQTQASADPNLSAVEALTGTPLYMAPEAVTDASSIDARADLYSLGAVAYYLLTGERVFEGKTVVQVCGHHLFSPVVPPSKRLGRALPEALERIVLDCLEKDRDKRMPSASSLLARLEACGLAPWTADQAESCWAERAKDVTVAPTDEHRPSAP